MEHQPEEKRGDKQRHNVSNTQILGGVQRLSGLKRAMPGVGCEEPIDIRYE
jgi:hypothetical protein